MKATILLVDDDPVDIKSVQGLIEDMGFETVSARSGAEAVALLGSHPVDLVLSDVRMPGMTGEDVVREAVRLYPGLPVVLITGHGDIKSAVNAMKLGAADYILKPPDADELKLVLARAVENSRLKKENEFFRSELSVGGMYGERLIGRSAAMLAVFDIVDRVAKTDSTVLITGETGTGKELIAQTIHYRSRRAARPLVAFSCASLNANLIESELFGHEKGAFTGAAAVRRGRFEDADGGTIFLDEISETSLDFQAKLLRVLQEGEFERVGGNRKIRTDVRVLASTNLDLRGHVKAGKFREDLFYRLSVIPLHLPPLRERGDDISALALHFTELYSRRYGCRVSGISKGGLKYLSGLEWKGNVRELQHSVERAVVLSRSEILEADDFKGLPDAGGAEEEPANLERFVDVKTREHLLKVLDRAGWRKNIAADMLGIDRTTLYRLLQRHSIEKQKDREET